MRALLVLLSVPAMMAVAGLRSGTEPPPSSNATGSCDHLPQRPGARAAANDNRVAAGVRRGDTVHLSLTVVHANWYPEADDGCGLPVLAFAESGRAPSVPGPLVRVSAGTLLRIAVRNTTERPLWLRGLHDRPVAPPAAVALPANSARLFEFRVTTPGTYAYGATLVSDAEDVRLVRSFGDASQLVGAFIVDSANAPPPRDRVFVLTRWVVLDPADSLGRPLFGTGGVNGKSWPHTERLTHTVGDTVHWRVINGASAPHPMHLHGFYFSVDAKGHFTGDTVLHRPRLVVTENLASGQTMQMTWIPERPGNWLFHCHVLLHMEADQRLDRMSDAARMALGVPVRRGSRVEQAGHGSSGDAAHRNHALEGMAGLILGVHVQPSSSHGPSSDAMEVPRRALRLFANERRSMRPDAMRRYGFVLQEDDREPASDSVRVPGSTLVLQRGEPVRITVFNRLSVPLSVHWHGLELESFFDGVGDWSGSPGSIAPPIAPGDSFAVHLTPPRTGTFMYHVHGEEGRELTQGLHAPLIVVDSGVALDTLTDHTLLVSDGGLLAEAGVFVNGSAAPKLTLTAGRAHRLRIMGITSNAGARLTILDGADTVRWRLLALDGADLTGERAPLTAAHLVIAPGMIADYELTPSAAGELTLHVATQPPPSPNQEAARRRVRRWTAPITVLAPRASADSRIRAPD